MINRVFLNILSWFLAFGLLVAAHVYFPVDEAIKNHLNREFHIYTEYRCYGFFLISVCKSEPTFSDPKSYIGIFNNFIEI